MNKAFPLLVVACLTTPALHAQAAGDSTRWAERARAVTITRDDWGIAHVHGRTDADAVFGMIYAQAEDDFNRVETNYLTNLGRTAQVEGQKAVWQDLRQRLFVNDDSLKAMYGRSPAWLKTLMDAWADGLNYYLVTHPATKPRLLTRWEPWMALSFTEGSIGGDIESISLAGLATFYGDTASRPQPTEGERFLKEERAARAAGIPEPAGSNGFAIAPANTANRRALFLINPHTTFFFRSELQMTSDEGLRAYGAVTWGQFFIYQGFNDRLGFMHTSTGADNIDEFAETIVRRDGRLWYKYGQALRPLASETITVPVKDGAARTFTVYRTHHGPVVRAADGKWVSVALMNKPIAALSQSFLRTKARSLAEFRKVLELKANSSNNTIYADADGNIAYFHPQFMPRRDDRFDYTRPVDGSDPRTDWHGLHSLATDPTLINPKNGWIQNTNNWPYSAAGPYSPKRERFPKYMDAAGENARGIHAMRVLGARKDFTLQTLIDAAFDSWMPAFDELVPPLVQAWDALAQGDARKAALGEQVGLLRAWNRRWGAQSVETSLAVYYGQDLWQRLREDAERARVPVYQYVTTRATAEQRLAALQAASDRLAADFGSWKTPWGEINRFQRLTGDIQQPFSDQGPSIPVPFTSGNWGSLASFGARTYPGTKRMYGTSGNSFVAVVEFGKDSVRARAVTAGGESGDPKSKHFDDQAERYASGNLREVYFYPNQLQGHTERTYRPGE